MTRLLYILVVAFAILAIQTNKIRRAVIYVGIFALVISLCYISYSAPDVAIAQAVITSTLGTFLYLAALQKKKVFMIYYTNEDHESIDDAYVLKGRISILNMIEQHCFKNGVDSHVVFTTQDLEYIKEHEKFDLIIRQKGSKISIYGLEQNYLLDKLKTFMEENEKREVMIYKLAEGVVE